MNRNGYNQTKISLSHPNLYRGIMTFAFVNIGLGLNFFFTNPTFNPYQIDKALVGSIFMTLGISKIIFLNISRNLRVVRAVMAAEVIFMLFWGIGTTITFFQGRTSLQLFVLYAGLAMLELFLLQEPAVNPVTEIKKLE